MYAKQEDNVKVESSKSVHGPTAVRRLVNGEADESIDLRPLGEPWDDICSHLLQVEQPERTGKFIAYVQDLPDVDNIIEAVLGSDPDAEQSTPGAIPQTTYPLTDCGNAERLAASHAHELRSSKERGWFTYTGSHWESNRFTAMQLVKETVRRIVDEAWMVKDPALRKKILAWARASESASHINAMLKLAESDPRLEVKVDKLDIHRTYFNCSNGTLDLAAGQLRSHNPEDLITMLAPVEYSPDAKCPKWLEFLNQIMDGNQDLVAFLKRGIGYSLSGDVSEQCLFFCHGTGSNGKTTLLETVMALAGDYGQSADFATFLAKPYAGIPNDVARMAGKRFIISVEATEGREFATSTIKKMTGGDKLLGRFLFQEYFEFAPQFKLWLAANHKPVVPSEDDAFWRRVYLVPFNVKILPDQVDRTLSAQLRAELPGILAWAVSGYQEWQGSGLQPPKEVLAATKLYRDEMDVIGDFIKECCTLHSNAKVKSSVLYTSYKAWADGRGEKPKDNKKFNGSLLGRGLTERHNRDGNHFYGIGLISDMDS